MNRLMALAVALFALGALVAAEHADARRMGGGRSLGAQRQVTPAPAPPTSPSVAPAPSSPMQAAPAKAATAPAASGASRWLGPIAGLAAGLGLAALLSHLGLSETFASFLLLALLVGGGFFLLRMLLARRAPAARPLQYAGAGAATPRVEPRLDPSAPARFEPVMGAASGAAPVTAAPAGNYPPGFDPAPFVAQAKLQFHKLQAAFDSGDRKALADVMTPEMFVEVTRELADRGSHLPTEIMRLDATILEATTEGDRHWMSVHFRGLLREDGTVLPKEFDEIWNLTKPVDGKSGWLLAGIQQADEVA